MIRRAAVALMGLALAASAGAQVQLPAPVQQLVQPVLNTAQPIVQPVVNAVQPIVQPVANTVQSIVQPIVQFPTGNGSAGPSAPPSSTTPSRPAPEQFYVPFSSAAGGTAGGFPQTAGGGVGPMDRSRAQPIPFCN